MSSHPRQPAYRPCVPRSPAFLSAAVAPVRVQWARCNEICVGVPGRLRPMAVTRLTMTFAIVALPVAVLRYFMKGWVGPLGVPVTVGSHLASLWILQLVAITLIFTRDTKYRSAVVAYALLAAWCELLVISGILITERTGADTYFNGPWQGVKEHFTSPVAHALGHAGGFVPRLLIGLLLGAVVHWLARRARRATRSMA